MIRRKEFLRFAMGGAVAAAASATGVRSAFAQSQEIVITHWGAALYGVPYAIAIEKKFFKEAGVDITGVLRSTGGGTSVRNVLAAGTGYGEVALPAAISGIREGLDFKIIHAGVVGYDMVYVAKPGSPLKSAEDIKGRKIGFTRPKSVTESFLIMLAEKLKIKRDEFQMVSIGSVGAGLTALEQGGVDATVLVEPILSQKLKAGVKYQEVFWCAQVLPAVTQTVGIVTGDYAKKSPDKVKAIVAARRKAVDYLYANPVEAGEIIGRAYSLDRDVAVSSVDNMIKRVGKWWSPGNFDLASMNEMLRGLQLVGEVEGAVDWAKVIDRSYLPNDLRT